jgi:hypothetical protein
VLQAYEDSPLCVQRDPFRRDQEVTGNEDCLYINIYTPQYVNKSLPVMVRKHANYLLKLQIINYISLLFTSTGVFPWRRFHGK